jgi:signal transduction histidine kinase
MDVVAFSEALRSQPRADLLHELGRLGVAVQGLHDEQEVFETIGRRLLECGYLCCIFLYRDGEFVIHHLNQPREQLQEFQERLGHPLTGMVMKQPSPAARAAIATGEPQFAASIEATEAAALSARLPAIYAPWTLHGRTAGVIMVYGTKVGPELVDAIGLFGSLLGSAVDNARLIAGLERTNRDFALLATVSESVTKSLDLKETLTTALRVLTDVLDASNAFIMLHDPAKEALVAAAATPPYDRDLDRLLVNIHEPSISAHCFRDGVPVMVEDTSIRGDFNAELVARFAEKALLAVPLQTRNGRIGAVVLDDVRRPRHFSAHEIELATAIANHVGGAIENARLYDEVQRRVSDLTSVAKVGEAVTGTLDLEKVLDTALRHMVEIVDVTLGHILLASADRKYIEGVAIIPHAPDEERRLRIAVDDVSIGTRCFREGRTVAVEDTQSGFGFSLELAARHSARALLGLPIKSRGNIVGVAVLCDQRRPRQFTPQEIERAGAIINHLAIAIENARLYEEQKLSFEKLATAQAELVRRERLAALGELSAVVAHEVRNPLGVIFNSIGSLKRITRLEGDAKKLLDIVAEEADHLNRLVGDLLEFARPRQPSLKPTNVCDVIEEAITSATREATAAITFGRDVAPQMPLVPMDRYLIRRALANVAVNAVQAMPKGGQVTFRARRDDRRRPCARIDVIDDGPGLPASAVGRVFEPFFTTKATGTGLGLAVVKRIIEDHHGEVSISNGARSGATVTLWLPLDADASA